MHSTKPAPSGAISARSPAVDIEYDCRGTRIRKHFADAHSAKRFFTTKFKLGRNPSVVNPAKKETTMAKKTATKATKKTTTKKTATNGKATKDAATKGHRYSDEKLAAMLKVITHLSKLKGTAGMSRVELRAELGFQTLFTPQLEKMGLVEQVDAEGRSLTYRVTPAGRKAAKAKTISQ